MQEEHELAASQKHPWIPLGERRDDDWESLGSGSGSRTASSFSRSALGSSSRTTTATSRSGSYRPSTHSASSPAITRAASVHGKAPVPSLGERDGEVDGPRVVSRCQSRRSSLSTGCSTLPPGTAAVPPATSNTTLSQLFRRATSTPAIRTSDGNKNVPWFCEVPAMQTKDLAHIVEHLHDKVLRQRRKRQRLKEYDALRESLGGSTSDPSLARTWSASGASGAGSRNCLED